MMDGGLDFAAMGRRIREARLAKGFTQERLAEGANITASFVGHIERAEKKPSAETIVALCDCLDITADYVLMGRENRCDLQRCALYGDLQALLSKYGR